MGEAGRSIQFDGIAIIGMACRFPGAKSVDEYWQNLRDGVESIAFFSDRELQESGVARSLIQDPDYVKAGGVLDDIDLFDASFFGFSPREAEILDPQHRLFLECAWEALESAGYDSESCGASIGVYAGAGKNTYFLNNLASNPGLMELVGKFQATLGNDPDFLATRVSYKLNLTGPSVDVQSACSTSLVAVHLACQSLLNGECDMALAGGVSAGVPQKEGYLYQKEGILSPDGHCRAFDAKAQGTVGGNGVGVVVLKQLHDAVNDGDCIHAVIKGSAINNDGSLKVGFTAPSVDGQAKVIAEALTMAEVDPETVSYVEAHGTGTSLGDPIEIAALKQAFRSGAKGNAYCALGSVKTNIGHANAAAGVSSLIKTVLALKHKQIPPSLYFEKPNPHLKLDNSPFFVNAELREWDVSQLPRRAGVSSFGIGGTNAHVVLEEAPIVDVPGSYRPEHLLTLSARTSSGLETATVNLAAYLAAHPDLDIADVAYTGQVGRRTFSERRMLVCRDLDSAVSVLESLDPARVFTSSQERSDSSVVFMFTGQGSQYANMALGLYNSEPDFREQLDECVELLKPSLHLDLRSLLFPSEQKKSEATKLLSETYLTQPALFSIEYALAKLWMKWGVIPRAMIGHSNGEYVAACLAGVFSLSDALKLVSARGRLMQRQPGGGMLVIPLPEESVQPLLGEQLSLAAVNAPSLCVVSGPHDVIDGLKKKLAEGGTICRRLHTSHAFHSMMMDSVLQPFTEEVCKVKLEPPKIPYISNVTGTWIKDEEATDANYWARHLRQTVRFSDGVKELLRGTDRVLLEVGPGRTLRTLGAQQTDGAGKHVLLSSLRHPEDSQSDTSFLLETLGKLWLAGVQVDWPAFHTRERRKRVTLPTYPFERQRYWVEPCRETRPTNAHHESLAKKQDISEWFYVPSWKRSFTLNLAQADFERGQKSRWLVFMDVCGLGVQLVEQLQKMGEPVCTVTADKRFALHGESSYTIDPRQAEDYQVLARALQEHDRVPNKILHLWGVTSNDQPQADPGFSGVSQFQGFYSLLFLAQALEKEFITDTLQIAVVTNNAQEVTGEEILVPEKATVFGPARVIPQEYPNITCRSIDIAVSEADSSAPNTAAQILAELMSQPTDVVVAYRGAHRWVQTFQSMRLGDSKSPQVRIRPGGVYLITGGLGGVGLILAEHLAESAQAKLVLVGRSLFPERDTWDSWLEKHDDDDAVSLKIKRIRNMEKLGAEVLLVTANVANLAEVRAAAEQTYRRFGGINGVIHAAAVVNETAFQSIKEVSRSECEKQFQAKIHGLVVLEKVFGDGEIDFCMLFSSLSSVLGGIGFAAYSAANIFVDTFARWIKQRSSFPWIAVDWDGWQVPEETERASGFGESLAEMAMKPREGIEAFERILSVCSLPQLIVSTGNLEQRFDQWVKLQSIHQTGKPSQADEEHLITTEPSSPQQTRALKGNANAPRSELEQIIADIWKRALGVDQVELHDNLFDLGGHSLLAIQVIADIKKRLGVQIEIKSLAFQTLGQLAGDCEEKMREQEQAKPMKLSHRLSSAIKGRRQLWSKR